MTSRAEKERQKAQQEKFQATLSSLLKDDDNKYCVDCDAKGKLETGNAFSSHFHIQSVFYSEKQ